MSTRLTNKNSGPDYLTAINNHATDIEALQASLNALTRPSTAIASPASNPFVYSVKTTPWSNISFQSVLQDSASSVRGSAQNFYQAVYMLTSPGTYPAYGIVISNYYPPSGTSSLFARAFSISSSYALAWLGSAITIASNTATSPYVIVGAKASSSTNLRLDYVYQTNTAASGIVVMTDIVLSVSNATLSANNVGSYTIEYSSNSTFTPSANPYGSLCGQFTMATYMGGFVGSNATPYTNGGVISHGTGSNPVFDYMPGMRSTGNQAVVANYGSHDFLGASDNAGNQYMVAGGSTLQGGEAVRPGLTMWELRDSGPRLIDRLSINDTIGTGSYPSVYGISPAVFVFQYAENNNASSRVLGVYGYGVSATKGPQLQQIVAPQFAGGFQGQVTGWLNYSATNPFFITREGVNSFKLRNATLNMSASPATFNESGTGVAFSFGSSYDTSSFVMNGTLRIDTDVVLLYGASSSTVVSGTNTNATVLSVATLS